MNSPEIMVKMSIVMSMKLRNVYICLLSQPILNF